MADGAGDKRLSDSFNEAAAPPENHEPAGGDGPADADPGLSDSFNEAAAPPEKHEPAGGDGPNQGDQEFAPEPANDNVGVAAAANDNVDRGEATNDTARESIDMVEGEASTEGNVIDDSEFGATLGILLEGLITSTVPSFTRFEGMEVGDIVGRMAIFLDDPTGRAWLAAGAKECLHDIGDSLRSIGEWWNRRQESVGRWEESLDRSDDGEFGEKGDDSLPGPWWRDRFPYGPYPPF